MPESESIVRRMYDTVACYWVLLIAQIRKSENSRPGRGRDAKVEHCLKLQKGTRFQLSGGAISVSDSREREEDAGPVRSVTPARR